MRILSARIIHARRDSRTRKVEAIVRLMAESGPGGGIVRADVTVAAPGRAPGAARLRERLLAAAKLAFAAAPSAYRARRAA